jgi:glycerophosphoryl diester phosphodiesterase
MIHPSKLVAHRGYQAKYPENTALSLTKAIKAGAVFIELDVQFSADRLPIIYHDVDLLRVSGTDLSVFLADRADLLCQPAYEPARLGNKFIDEKISPLEILVDILVANPQVTAFVEIKDESVDHCGREAMIQSVMEILQPVKQQSVMMSFDYPLAIAAREAGWPMVGVVLKSWDDLQHPELALALPDYIYSDYNIIPDQYDLRNSPQLAAAQLVTYEVGTAALAQTLLGRGVDMLETFEIEVLLGT